MIDGRDTPIWTKTRIALGIPPGLWAWHFANALGLCSCTRVNVHYGYRWRCGNCGREHHSS